MQIFEPLRQRAFSLVEQALALVNVDSVPGEEGVHDIRLATKKLRALRQLLRQEQTRKEWRKADKELRDASRMLAQSRDALVWGGLLKDLAGELEESEASIAALEAAAEISANAKADIAPEEWTRMRPALEKIFRREAKAWENWQTPKRDEAILTEGLERLYRKPLRWAKKAFAKQDSEIFHQWRKWNKYFGYALKDLSFLNKEFSRLAKRHKKIGSILGTEHDYAGLLDALDRMPEAGVSTGFEALRQEIVQRQTQLRVKAEKRFDEEFALTPREFRTQAFAWAETPVEKAPTHSPEEPGI